MLQDAHIHLQDAAGEVDRILDSAAAEGVGRFFCNGAAPSDWTAVKSLAGRYESVVPFFGVHPWYADEARDGWDAELIAYLAERRPCIGEIGLDKAKRAIPFERQVEVFRRQLEIAARLRKPFTVHCVQAWEALIEELRRGGGPKTPFIVHRFSGSPEVAAQLIALGAYISFSPRLFDENAVEHRDAFEGTPADRILLETDYPYMPGIGAGTAKSAAEYFDIVRRLYALAAKLKMTDQAAFEKRVWDNGTVFVH